MPNSRRSVMAAVLQIGIDPTDWYFDADRYDAVAAWLAQPSAPLVVDVSSPLEGRLVLNPLAAGSVALTKPIPGHWNPNGSYFATSLGVYVPSATGPHKGLPGYTLSRDYELLVVEQEIIDAMTGETMLTLALETGTGVLALSGATLSYAVLCPPKL
jgi:hypothetical protein